MLYFEAIPQMMLGCRTTLVLEQKSVHVVQFLTGCPHVDLAQAYQTRSDLCPHKGQKLTTCSTLLQHVWCYIFALPYLIVFCTIPCSYTHYFTAFCHISGSYIRRVFNISLGVLIAYLSIPVVQNLLSSRQHMNTSFEPLRIVNTYGAFGRWSSVYQHRPPDLI